MAIQLNQKQKENILSLCDSIAASRKIIAVCMYGPWTCGYADEKTEVNVLLILENFSLRLNTYRRTIKDTNISILTVNRLDFERDVTRGWLGEFLAEKLTVPYKPLKNREYLQLNETKIKKRTILGLIENLIIEFPESSNQMLINNDYFMYEDRIRRAKIFPPLTYSYLNMFHGILEKKNKEKIIDGYMKALEELEREKIILRLDKNIRITQNHIDSSKKKKNKLPPILKSLQRVTVPFLNVISESTATLIQDQRLYSKTNQKASANKLISKLEDPKKHVFFPTPLGLVSLSDKSDIRDVAQKIIPNGEVSSIKVESIGGVLNDVYILTLIQNGEEKKIVVKQFLDWSNLKWLSLTLWSFGTTSFSVLGQSRLEKEYAINKFLYNKSFPVPKILYISHQKRLIFEEYVEGKGLVENVKRLILFHGNDKDILLIKEAGRKIAQAHKLGVSLGDCKPENFIVSKNDDIVILDLEQATRNGNQAWDIAEFLYYSGHYSSPMSPANACNVLARNFIEGYLEAGGKKELIKEAASARYTKVFSIFTPPQILIAISSIFQKMGKAEG